MDGGKPSQRPRLLKRGGARNRADRMTMALTEKQCRGLITAAQATLADGRGFNRMVNISWECGGLEAKSSVSATGKFIDLARDWFRARGHNLLWAWVQEYGTTHKAHCHILLHVPVELADLFGTMPLRWVKSILNEPYRSKVLNTRRWRTEVGPFDFPDTIEAMTMGYVHYMLKGAPRTLEEKLGMAGKGREQWGRYSPVYGKRLAVSQSCFRLIRKSV